MPKIVILSGMNMGDWYSLTESSLIFGRDESLLAEINDCFVSFRHLKISFDPRDSEYYISDMGSRNGLIINGHQIKHTKKLIKNDLVQIGYTLMIYTHENLDEYRAVERFTAQMRARYLSLIDQLTSKRDRLLEQLNNGTHSQNAITIADNQY
ncbi:FHA domain-containing protein FhaB [Poriferisphaera corsica]|uniref:FHA domain-containing protein FhaB n=1 Tax=Poriferisphaera corsica TaxID=2528020 RepID=A0A517YZ13_9BACT|nr:FHA domain-containing protein [Poriferisphaera corsica]QDU35463.1 FHA domain-containing protein FhaB [Poriferisphaera corsica]